LFLKKQFKTHHFRFVEEFSRSIGFAKADVAARESAINESTPQQSSSNVVQASETGQPSNNQQAANVEPNQIPLPEGEPLNRVEINDGNQQVLLEVFEDNTQHGANDDGKRFQGGPKLPNFGVMQQKNFRYFNNN
jgi:hypothetical protein